MNVTQTQCVLNKSKVEQAVKHFWHSSASVRLVCVGDVPHVSLLQLPPGRINNLHGVTLKFQRLPQTCVTLIC